MPSWHNVTVPDATPKVGNNSGAALYGLGSGQYDGHPGRVRVGSGVNAYVEDFLWDVNARAGAGGWVGSVEHTVMKADDAWALDWTRQPLSAIRNAWVRPNGGVGWARSGAAAFLIDDVTIPASGSFVFPIAVSGSTSLPVQGNLTARGMTFAYTGVDLPGTTVTGANAANSATINVASTTGFPTSGKAQIGADVVSYTGVTGTSLTGCGVHPAYVGGELVKYPRITGVTSITSTPGTVLKANYTPIIPYAPVLGGGGDPGGWGTTTVPLLYAGELWAAGFRLEERLHAWMNGSNDLKSLQIAPFYMNYNLNEDFNYPTLSGPPPAGLLGPGYTIVGPPIPMAGIGGTGSGTVIEERTFKHFEGDWATWVPAAPTKTVLWPILYGKMPADAEDTGQSYGVTLKLRWYQP